MVPLLSPEVILWQSDGADIGFYLTVHGTVHVRTPIINPLFTYFPYSTDMVVNRAVHDFCTSQKAVSSGQGLQAHRGG